MDLDLSNKSQIFRLNKKEVTKRLQDAVRQSQGGAKRASWAEKNCPFWWKSEQDVRLSDGEVVKTLKFESQSKGYWDIDSARATLLLYENREKLRKMQLEQAKGEDIVELESKVIRAGRNVEKEADKGGELRMKTRARGNEVDARKEKNNMAKSEVIVVDLDKDESVVEDTDGTNDYERQDKGWSNDKEEVANVNRDGSTDDNGAPVEIKEKDRGAEKLKGERNIAVRRDQGDHKNTMESYSNDGEQDGAGEVEGEDERKEEQEMNTSKDVPDSDSIVAEDPENGEYSSAAGSEKKSGETMPASLAKVPDQERTPEPVEDAIAAQEEKKRSERSKRRGVVQHEEETSEQSIADTQDDIPEVASEEVAYESSMEMDADGCQEQLENEKVKLQRKVEMDLAKFRRTCKAKRDTITRKLGVEIDRLKSEHKLVRYPIPKEALDMPMKDYVKKCNADSHKWLLQAVEGQVTRACMGVDSESTGQLKSTVSAYQQARREEIIRTTRKATRAARERENLISKTPATLARTRPRRTAAETATRRNQAILGRNVGSVKTASAHTLTQKSQEGSDDKPQSPEAQKKLNAEMMDREAVIKMLRTKKDPRKFFEECLAAYSQNFENES